MKRISPGVLFLAGAAVFSASCGVFGTSSADLKSYMNSVEPIRLGVNQLLNTADPILSQFQDHQISGQHAADAMSGIEEKFATYTVEINALVPSDPTMASINAPYAHTYILEDAYLNALVLGLARGDLTALPNTQSEQRAAIIEWRIHLEVLAKGAGVTLPADLQQAGRGEIAPSIGNS